MMIDLSTIRSLELIQNITNVKSKDCLFGLLNETLTPMGSRMLRSNILQPSTQESILKNRYKAVGELASTEETFFDTRNALKPFLDIDKLLTNLIIQPTQPDIQHSEQSINHILMLKTFVQCVGPVYEALSGARSPLLVDIRNVCRPNNITPTLKIIGEVINDDVTFQRSPLDLRNQRTYAVKSGVNGLLDVARQTFKEATQDVHQHVSDINDQYEMQMETRYDNARRYYLRIQESNLEGRTMPDILINCYRKKGYIECQTLGLVKLNQRIEDSHQEVVLMSDKTVTQLIDNVRAEIQPLFRVSDSIAMLDMLAAFAQLVTTSDYVKPEITRCLAIKSGRHPVHEKAHSEKFIPNDVYADKQQRFQIITGCNMSGKSTYIRSIALVTVMAQIGSFVPAQYASFPIVDQLFARVSMDDCIEANVSTFASEMRETAFILRNIGKNSLVIIDELGRGTSTRDGLAIALSISEALVESQAFVWFTTHFRELAQIMNERAGVVNMHLKVDISQEDKMVMLYKIANGFVKEEHYGLALARVVNLPPLVLEVAEKVSKTLQAQAAAKKKSSKSFAIARKRKLVLSLREVLLQAQESAMQGKALMEYLRKVQEEFVRRMDCIENEADDSGDESVIGEEELNENDDGRNEDLEREGEFNEAEDDSDESEMTGTDKTEMLV
ncbi:MutS protein msh4 [Pseudogymnoascus destructans]|uniref:MutS protein msh4 n=1 Tax=Pseudogymnoascus destructans TaxID=655981 RepID=A0A177A5B5_9PEZI|nr:MutS protein msh4 [Pseudogymnoascus destructans]OAF56820.2 MutS protein msh4 [Pseudogymnoascus destructans]